jgi:hypothetical protein
MNATSTLATLISLSINHDLSFAMVISPWLVAGTTLLAAIIIAVRWWLGWRRGPNFEIDKAEFGLTSGTISFRPNHEDEQIAYKIWVELSTRKIGLPIDLEHDVVVEVYDSWHNFFSITRELIKDVPVNKVKNSSTRKIIELSIDLLNDGLRPHLTTWQARFRRWYEKQLERAQDDVEPQYIQKNYPKYAELEKDLKVVNERLIKYRSKMQQLVLGLPTPPRSKEG